jgi:outer membrane protein assembly factor BamB
LAVFFLCVCADAADGPSWPRFHGPDGTNKSSDTGLLKKWPEKGPKLLWTAKGIGNGYSSVTIADGMIFTAGNIEKKTVVAAMDLNGKIKWQYENGPAWLRSHPGTRGTPTVDGERLYHQSPLGQLVCLVAKTGKKVWDVNTYKTFGGRKTYWAFAESVLVDGDRVISCPGGAKASVVALNKTTGKVVWTASDTGEANSYATPALVVQDGLRMILTMTGKGFMGVGADDGSVLFRAPFETRHYVNALMPLHHDGHVFLSGGYGTGSKLMKLTVKGKAASVKEVWQSKALDNHHGGVMLVDGRVYGASHGGKWTCLDWKTGKTQWSDKGVGKGSVTMADGMLYMLSEKRKVGLAKPTPKGYGLVSQFEIPDQGKGPSWAHPVVCGGRLYIRHGDFLYAYDLRAK